MTMSFDDWKLGKVAPVTVEIPVTERTVKKEGDKTKGK